ncbi:MAG: IclR family transcriptional regulator [Chloroflexota bacterium]|nr:IclR family transcriptional regulator [Chloroflexota bacterium]MDE3100639.1 IclR family transcriptional regulator [Chloroflexota bacterium]
MESLGRGLAVLSAFAADRRELSLRDVAEAADVSTPSALRIGYTLVELGYLVRDPLTKRYRPGPKLLAVGMASLSSMSLLELAEPYLVELRDRTEETVKLAILDDTEMVYVARIPSLTYPALGSGLVGTRLPACQTCTGRAILSKLPDREVRTVVQRSTRQKFTEKTITSIDEILTEIKRTRLRGYAVNDQGTTIEHRSAAVAICDASGQPVGAVNVSVSAQRVSLGELTRRLVPHVVTTAERISALLPPQFEGMPPRPALTETPRHGRNGNGRPVRVAGGARAR